MFKKLFCNHIYLKSVSCKSERVGNHNYAYDYEYYKCEKCKHTYTIKELRQIDKNYYREYGIYGCSKCVFEEDNANTEPCKSCIADKQKASLFKRDKKLKIKTNQ